jgi:hypothetical protein
MNDVKTESLQGKPVEPIALLDCGQASEVTKGVPFLVLFELAPAPWDRALIF